MKHIAIIMAAGSGSRMGTDVPKQYLTVKGRPVLYFSIKAFEDSFFDEIVLVTRKDDVEYCKKEIVEKFSLKKVKKIVPGGSERFESVFEGIKATGASPEDYVYIHDGARPLVSGDVLERTKNDVMLYDATVVSVASKDTVKIADENGFVVTTPDRRNVRNIQTPQAFKYSVIYDAFVKMISAGDRNITDDGMVVERYSDVKVHLTEGDYSNVKITTVEDWEVISKKLENF